METRNDFSRSFCVISRRATSAIAGRPSQPAHAATALRKSSDSVGRSSAKCVTVPAARAASSSASGGAPSRSATSTPSGPRSTISAPGTVASHSSPRPVHRDPHGRARRAARAQVLDPSGGHEPAVLDDRHRLAQPLDELELVRGEDHRDALVGEPLQHAAEHVDADGVEPRERLVEHEQLRPVHERRAELHALLVAERQRLHAVARAVGDPEPLEPAVGRRRRVAARESPCSEAK